MDSIIKEQYGFSPNEVFQKLAYLKIFPKMYPKLSEKSIYRKIIIKKYIILYFIINNTIYINDIIHQKSKILNNQDLRNLNKKSKNKF